MANITGNGTNENLSGTADADTIEGRGGNDTLQGLAGNDILRGEDGDDILVGGDGDDLLDGGLCADNMRGGLGDDIYVVDDLGDTVIELDGQGVDTVQSSVSFTIVNNIENLTLLGSGNISATGNSGANILIGNDGDNLMRGGDGDDTISGGSGDDIISGNVGDDIISGDAGNDVLSGKAGNDQLDGGTGADQMVGGVGDDTYTVDNAGDVVIEVDGEGTDTVRSTISLGLGNAVENLTLLGSANLNGTGNAANNTIIGNDGNNVLRGGAGADTMSGGIGADTLIGETGDDILSGGADNDTLSGQDGDDTMDGGTGADRLDGGLGGDNMIGGAGDDTFVVDDVADIVQEIAGEGTDTVESSIAFGLSSALENLTLTGAANIDGIGNAADNVMIGNDGNNVLRGGAGVDTMSGGLGVDTLIGNVGDDVLSGGAGDDTLSGADGADQMDGGTGADRMFGGAGNDSYVVDNVGDRTIENAGQGTDSVLASISTTLKTNVENLTLATGAGAINGVGNSAANVMTGNESNNILTGAGGADSFSAGDGDDVIVVSDTSFTTVAGDAGADILRLEGAGLSVNLTARAPNLTGLEAIDLRNAANATVDITAADIAPISGGTEFFIFGAVDDTVNAGNGWTFEGSVTRSVGAETSTFNHFSQAGVSLFVEGSIANLTIGVAAPNQGPTVDLNGLAAGGQDFTGTADADGTATAIAANDAVITDPDAGQAMSAMTVALTSPVVGTEALTLSANGVFAASLLGVVVTGNGGTALTFAGAATTDQYECLLAEVRYAQTDAAASLGDVLARTIEVVVTDAEGADSNTAVATINVNGLNDAPTVVAGVLAADEDGAAAVFDLSTIGDDIDSDDDGASLTYTIVTQPGEGSASISGTDLSFDPGADFQDLAVGETRDVTITVQAQDQHGADSGTADITVTVTGANDAPTVVAGVAAADEDGAAVVFDLSTIGDDVDSDDDGASLTYTILSATPSEGSVSISGASLSFDPGADFQDLAVGETRDVTITVQAQDQHGADSGTADITVTVTGTNDAPTVVAGVLAADEDGAAAVFDLSTIGDDIDSDDDGASLTYTIVTQPGEGSASISGTDLSFDPGADFQDLAVGETRDVTITVQAQDQHGADSGTADITVTVTGTNDAPTVVAGVLAADEDGAAVVFDLSTIGDDVDSDDDGASLTYTILSATPSEGSVSISGASLSFDPGADFQDLAEGQTRQVTITIQATDGHSAIGSGDVTVTVTGVNDAPTLDLDADGADDGFATRAKSDGGAVAIADSDAAIDDIDSDGGTIDQLTATIQGGGAANEALSLSANGAFVASLLGVTVAGSGTGALTFTGSATADQYETLLREIRYANSEQTFALDPTTRLIGVAVTDDGNATSNTAAASIILDARVSDTTGLDAFTGGEGNDIIDGLGGNDVLDGGEGDDALIGGAGDDDLSGGENGRDVASYAGSRDDYTITKTSDNVYQVVDNNAVDGDEGTDTLTEVEEVDFADIGFNIELDVKSIDFSTAFTRFNQDFEANADGFITETNGWSGSITPVASGTGGIASKDGGDFAIFTQTNAAGGLTGPFSRFDGFRNDLNGGIVTSVDIFLDPDALAAGEGFDFSIAANRVTGAHLQDFIFHVTKDTGTGELQVGASNNTDFIPKENLETINHATLESAEWYTFEHKFYENADGVLEVALNVYNQAGDWLFTEIRAFAGNLVGTVAGGSRYLWFTNIDVAGGIAVDNVTLKTINDDPVQLLSGSAAAEPANGSTIQGTFLTIADALAAAADLDSGATQPVPAAAIDITIDLAAGDYSAESPIAIDIDNLSFRAPAGAVGLEFVLDDAGLTFNVEGGASAIVAGGLGADAVTAGSGGDTLSGGAGDDSLQGGGGDDALDGGNGNDTIDGGAAADQIIGGIGVDLLSGGDNDQANDTLSGNGKGPDGSIDTFRFVNLFGNDTVTDFEDGVDQVVLDITGLSGAAQVFANDSGADHVLTVVVDGLASASVTLVGMVGQIDQNDFSVIS